MGAPVLGRARRVCAGSGCGRALRGFGAEDVSEVEVSSPSLPVHRASRITHTSIPSPIPEPPSSISEVKRSPVVPTSLLPPPPKQQHQPIKPGARRSSNIPFHRRAAVCDGSCTTNLPSTHTHSLRCLLCTSSTSLTLSQDPGHFSAYHYVYRYSLCIAIPVTLFAFALF